MVPVAELNILESVGLSGMGALFRGGKKKKAEHGMYCSGEECKGCESNRVSESSRIIEVREAVPETESKGKEGPIAYVVLISEGLGNLRDKNFYGPEAIQSAPRIFEGCQMMVDHASYSEERDIPEGRVNHTVAYYKNLKVEKQTDGTLACVGEAHFDLSEEGINAFQKARTAVHYSKEFPSSDKEYVGLSVNASGESEPRTMVIDGQEMEVNYVMRFVEARSCDMVTIPARGGKIRATVESIAGAGMKNKEVRMKTVETLEGIVKALTEAEGLKAPDPCQKKISEARKSVESLIKGVLDAAARRSKEGKKKEEEDESEDESEAKREAKKKEEEAEAAREAKKREEENGGDDDGDDDDGDKKKAEAIRLESKRATELAVKQLISESGLNPKYFDVKELEGMSLKEAEREIARTKRVHEASTEELVKKFGDGFEPAHRTKESGGAGGTGGKIEATNNAEFADLSAV